MLCVHYLQLLYFDFKNTKGLKCLDACLLLSRISYTYYVCLPSSICKGEGMVH